VGRFEAEDLIECALKHRQLDEDQHRLERLRGHRLPADIVGGAPVVRKKEPFLIRLVIQGCPSSRSSKSTSPDVVHARNGSLTEGAYNVPTVGAGRRSRL
jgi:hypothetical protein